MLIKESYIFAGQFKAVNNKLKYLLLLGFISCIMWMNAQDFGENAVNSPVEEQPIVVKKQGFNPDVSVTLGSSFTSFSPGVSAFGTYIMPEFTFPVTEKFAVRAGIGYSNMFFLTPGNEGSVFGQNNAQYGHVYVSGIYQLNDKVTIAGTAYKTFDLAPQPQNQANPRALDYSNEGIAVNVDYQVSDRVSFNVGFSYQKSNSYGNYYNPGGYNMNPSPFYNSGFGSGFGPGF